MFLASVCPEFDRVSRNLALKKIIILKKLHFQWEKGVRSLRISNVHPVIYFPSRNIKNSMLKLRMESYDVALVAQGLGSDRSGFKSPRPRPA